VCAANSVRTSISKIFDHIVFFALTDRYDGDGAIATKVR
jgi:hypothetical protein